MHNRGTSSAAESTGEGQVSAPMSGRTRTSSFTSLLFSSSRRSPAALEIESPWQSSHNHKTPHRFLGPSPNLLSPSLPLTQKSSESPAPSFAPPSRPLPITLHARAIPPRRLQAVRGHRAPAGEGGHRHCSPLLLLPSPCLGCQCTLSLSLSPSLARSLARSSGRGGAGELDEVEAEAHGNQREGARGREAEMAAIISAGPTAKAGRAWPGQP